MSIIIIIIVHLYDTVIIFNGQFYDNTIILKYRILT